MVKLYFQLRSLLQKISHPLLIRVIASYVDFTASVLTGSAESALLLSVSCLDSCSATSSESSTESILPWLLKSSFISPTSASSSPIFFAILSHSLLLSQE
jgi:hypothetical protein